jgi:hypothetical protein
MVACDSGEAVIVNATAGQIVREVRHQDMVGNPSYGVDWSADGRRLAVGFDNGHVAMHDMTSQRWIWAEKRHDPLPSLARHCERWESLPPTAGSALTTMLGRLVV